VTCSSRNVGEGLTYLGNVPNEDDVVKASREEDILGSWVPFDDADPTLVSLEIDERFVKVFGETTFWDLPHLHEAVLGTRGNDIVVEWAELEVEDSSLVSGDLRRVQVDTTSLKSRRFETTRVGAPANSNQRIETTTW
jgi:hypothetical protein